jgi:hypothetical protein
MIILRAKKKKVNPRKEKGVDKRQMTYSATALMTTLSMVVSVAFVK